MAQDKKILYLMKTRKIIFAIPLLFIVPAISAQDHAAIQMTESAEQAKAICVLYPTEGNEASGIVTFISTPDGVKVTTDIYGLTPSLAIQLLSTPRKTTLNHSLQEMQVHGWRAG